MDVQTKDVDKTYGHLTLALEKGASQNSFPSFFHVLLNEVYIESIIFDFQH